MRRSRLDEITKWSAMAVAIAGLSIFVRGVWLAWRPGGWMVAGLAIAAMAFCVAYDKLTWEK